ncbi:MAG: TetR/AcrR family transcriptional regulator [Fusobacteriaceae bacterium]
MEKHLKINKKNLIINSSKELILKKGYKKTSVENITSYANISKGSFYTYFKSKDLLLMEIISEISEVIKENQIEFFVAPKKDLETTVLKVLEKRFYLEKDRIMNILFLINLTSNLEALGEKIREKIMLAKEISVEFWMKILKEQNEVLEFTEKEIRDYALLIDEIIYYSVKKVIFYSHDKGIYITEVSVVNDKIASQETKEEIMFLKKIIMNILKGER